MKNFDSTRKELEALQAKGYKQKLYVLLKTLECRSVEELMEQPSPYLVRVALEITESAKLNKTMLARQCDLAREAETEKEALSKKYYDLIMCVSNKYPTETRHETAKRYIMEREQSSNCSVAVDRLQG